MAYPKPFRIETPRPSPEETAKKLGVSAAEVRRLKRAVQDIVRGDKKPAAPRHRKAAARS